MTIQIERLERLAVMLDHHQEKPGHLEFDLKHWTKPKRKDDAVQ